MKAEYLEEGLSAIILDSRTSIEIRTGIGRLNTTEDRSIFFRILSDKYVVTDLTLQPLRFRQET